MHRKSILYLMSIIGLLTMIAFTTIEVAFGEEEQVVRSDKMLVVETSAPVSAENSAPDLAVTAKGAVLLDADSGAFLYEQNSHESLPPTSITKIMTMLLALEAVGRGQITLEYKVTISERTASMGGSQMYMEKGKERTEFGLTNTNRLIKLHPGANGIKTGFTQEAGYCLSGSATYESAKIAQKGENFGSIEIGKGAPNLVNVVTPDDIHSLMKKREGG